MVSGGILTDEQKAELALEEELYDAYALLESAERRVERLEIFAGIVAIIIGGILVKILFFVR